MEKQRGNIQASLWRRKLKKECLANICAITAIALTSILFTSIFTVAIQFYEKQKEHNLQIVGWKAQAMLRDVSDKQYHLIQKNRLVRQVSYFEIYGNVMDDEIQNATQVQYNAKKAAEWNCYELIQGEYPKAENEVVVSDTFLSDKGIVFKKGQSVQVKFQLNGKSYEKKAVLSGYYKSKYSGQDVVLISKGYAEQLKEELAQDSSIEDSYIGTKIVEVFFCDSKELETKLTDLCQNIHFGNMDECTINSAYSKKVINGEFIIFLAFSCCIVGCMGILMVYNVYSISVVKDIQFYGLLRMIGFGRKNIKKLFFKQILVHGICGISIGLLIGNTISKIFMKKLALYFSVTDSSFHITGTNIIRMDVLSILLISGVLFISYKKPAKMAYSISPVEARKYQDRKMKTARVKKTKISKRGAKIPVMAYKNIWRERKRAKYTIGSIALSLVLFELITSLVSGLDVNTFVDKQVNSDFSVATKSYFSENYNRDIPTLNADIIRDLKGISESNIQGGICHSSDAMIEENDVIKKRLEALNLNEDEVTVDTYGMDSFIWDYLNVDKGSFDKKRFESGNYIVVSELWRAGEKALLYDVGDKVCIYHGKVKKSYEIMAVADLPISMKGALTINGINLYLPDKQWKELFGEKNYYLYMFNCKKSADLEKVNNTVARICSNRNKMVSFNSKETVRKQFDHFFNGCFFVGASLCAVIGIIGIANFINLMCTSIIKRKKEFAMMECIGMNRKTMKKIVQLEGVYFIGISFLLAFVFGIVITGGILKLVEHTVWFYHYKVNLISTVYLSAFLLVLALIVPKVSFYRMEQRESLLERLR